MSDEMPEGLTDREMIDALCSAATDYGYRCASVSRELSIGQELLEMKRAGDALEAHIATLRAELEATKEVKRRYQAHLGQERASIMALQAAFDIGKTTPKETLLLWAKDRIEEAIERQKEIGEADDE